MRKPTSSSPEPSASAWLGRLGGGEVSSRELVERTLARIETADRELNAVVATRPEQSLAAAEEADRRRAAGEDLPLLGLPVTIKDTLDVAGWPTTAGVVAARNRIAAGDSTAVARLRAAGAIVVAKTNVPECSSDAETDNALFGRTDNPHDRERTPGGSSGGEAALMGADASLVGLGVDGGCSIRLPSHYCGGVGIRPTAGRVPETGLWPSTRATGMFDLSCVGPMGRYVCDLELLLGVIAGADGVDPLAPPVPVPVFGPGDLAGAAGRALADGNGGAGPGGGSWLPGVDQRGSRGAPVAGRSADESAPDHPLRIGFYTEDPHAVPTAATVAAVVTAAGAIGDAEEIEPPPAASANDVVFGAIGADGGAHIKEVAGAGPHTPRFQAFLDEALPAEPPSSVETLAHFRRLFELRAAIRAHLAPYDVVVCPVAPGPAPRHGEAPAEGPGGVAEGYSWLNYASTYSVAGLPVAVVPAGAEGGLPIGVQIVAPPFREDLALAAARRVESALGGFRPATFCL